MEFLSYDVKELTTVVSSLATSGSHHPNVGKKIRADVLVVTWPWNISLKQGRWTAAGAMLLEVLSIVLSQTTELGTQGAGGEWRDTWHCTWHETQGGSFQGKIGGRSGQRSCYPKTRSSQSSKPGQLGQRMWRRAYASMLIEKGHAYLRIVSFTELLQVTFQRCR